MAAGIDDDAVAVPQLVDAVERRRVGGAVPLVLAAFALLAVGAAILRVVPRVRASRK